MLLLVLILVLVAFGLLVVALLTGNVLSAWLSVAVSVAAAVVLVVDWLQRRSAVKAGRAGADSTSSPPPQRPSGDLDPVTEVLPVYAPDSDPAGETVVAEKRPARAPDGQQTVVIPAVQPSGSAARPSGAEGTSLPSGGFSSPRVTGTGAESESGDVAPSPPDGPTDRSNDRSDAEATVVVDIRKAGIGGSSAGADAAGSPSGGPGTEKVDKPGAVTPGASGTDRPTDLVRPGDQAGSMSAMAGLAGAAVAGGLAAVTDGPKERSDDPQVVDVGKAGRGEDAPSGQATDARDGDPKERGGGPTAAATAASAAPSAPDRRGGEPRSEGAEASATDGPIVAGKDTAAASSDTARTTAGPGVEGRTTEGSGVAARPTEEAGVDAQPADDRSGTTSAADASPARDNLPTAGASGVGDAPARSGAAVVGAVHDRSAGAGASGVGDVPPASDRPTSAEAPGVEDPPPGEGRPGAAAAAGAPLGVDAAAGTAAERAAGTAEAAAAQRPSDARDAAPAGGTDDAPADTVAAGPAPADTRPAESGGAAPTTPAAEPPARDDQAARATFGGAPAASGHDLFEPAPPPAGGVESTNVIGSVQQGSAQQGGALYQAGDLEAPEESVDPALARVAAVVEDEVLVIDEQPRYHLMGCRAVTAQQTIPLPAREAVELGFTPCGWCQPAATLGARHPAAARP